MDERTPEERARSRVNELEGLLWHLAVYAIVNPFIWAIDIATGDGVQWAYWVSIPWAVGLLFHLASYFIDDSGMKERKYRKFLAEEREKELDSAA